MIGLAAITGIPAFYIFFEVPVLGGWYLFLLTMLISLIPLGLSSALYVKFVFVDPPNPDGSNLTGLLFMIVAIVMGVYGLLVTLNVQLDSSNPTSHRVDVVEKYQLSANLANLITGDPPPRKNHLASDFITVESWRSGRKYENFAVSNHLHSNLYVDRKKERVEVTVRSGLLGVPWVVGIEKVDAKENDSI